MIVPGGGDSVFGSEEQDAAVVNGGENQYEYVRLIDASKMVGQKANFYGVITEYEFPKPTSGKDFICTMTVTDMSWTSGSGLRVLVFGNQKNQIPLVMSIGDIIRFHRVKMDVHNQSLQAHATRGSAFLLFHGDGSSYEPYQMSANNYTFEDHDREILRVLLDWRANHPLVVGLASNDYLVQIRTIKVKPENNFFDLYCKLLHIGEEKFIYVWDGTDAVYTTSRPYVDESSMPLSILRTFPSKGSILEVFMDFAHQLSEPWLPAPGSWIKLRNITCRLTADGKLEGLFSRGSKICMLSSSTQHGSDAESWYENRLSFPEAGLPESCPKPLTSLTVTDYEHVPFVTLREVLAHDKVTWKFRCIVKVRAIWPSQVSDFCACAEGKFVYCLRMILEDPTAQLFAYLYGEDGDNFFNGYPAAQRSSEDACSAALERAVARLLGTDVGESPWIKCCLRSYYLDKDDPWSSRRFRIFGTRLP